VKANGGGVELVPPDADSTDEIEIDLDDGRGGGGARRGRADSGDPGIADAEQALEAMQHFRMAEAALQRNDVGAAAQLAQKAVDTDPSQLDYVTLLAWIHSLGGNPAAIEESIATMSRVLLEDPSNERALLYRGKLLARTSRLQEALQDFSELASQNPQNRDAQNELRLLKARLG
jgi:tetratricopeptide (TPR) repeat protein